MFNETAFDLNHEFAHCLLLSLVYIDSVMKAYTVQCGLEKLLSSLNTPRRIHDFLNRGLNYTSFK